MSQSSWRIRRLGSPGHSDLSGGQAGALVSHPQWYWPGSKSLSCPTRHSVPCSTSMHHRLQTVTEMMIDAVTPWWRHTPPERENACLWNCGSEIKRHLIVFFSLHSASKAPRLRDRRKNTQGKMNWMAAVRMKPYFFLFWNISAFTYRINASESHLTSSSSLSSSLASSSLSYHHYWLIRHIIKHIKSFFVVVIIQKSTIRRYYKDCSAFILFHSKMHESENTITLIREWWNDFKNKQQQ